MSENSPAPVPARGVYGFVLYLACTTGFILYIIWGFVPDSILHTIGITYYPQKYWAIALPVYALMGLALFAFFVYPALNMRLVPSLESTSSFTDQYTLRAPTHDAAGNGKRIEPAYDLPISEVSRKLYYRSHKYNKMTV